MQEKKVSKTNSEVKSTKTPEVKAVAQEVAKKVENVAEKTAQTVETKAKEAAKTTAKKAETVKKAAAKKTATKKKEAPKTEIELQIWDKTVSLTGLEEKVKAQFVAEGHRAGRIQNLEIYAKPEEGKAYYVINDGKFSGSVDLF